MNNIIKIKNLKHHYISEDGKVYSDYSGELVQIKTYLDSRQEYELITISESGHRYKFLIHRLVAEAFIPNPDNLPEVNHINFDKRNNTASNLEWCTRRDNNNHMFKVKSNVRNFKECYLYKSGHLIKKCKSVNEASRLAADLFGASYSSLNKYRKVKDIEIIIKETCNDYPVGE